MPGSGPWRRGEGSGLEQGLNLEACGWLPCHLPLGFLSWSWGLGFFLGSDMALGSVPFSPVGSAWGFWKQGPGQEDMDTFA